MTLGVRHVAVAITAILHAVSGILLVSRVHPLLPLSPLNDFLARLMIERSLSLPAIARSLPQATSAELRPHFRPR